MRLCRSVRLGAVTLIAGVLLLIGTVTGTVASGRAYAAVAPQPTPIPATLTPTTHPYEPCGPHDHGRGPHMTYP